MLAEPEQKLIIEKDRNNIWDIQQVTGQPLFYGEFYLVVFLFIFTPNLNY